MRLVFVDEAGTSEREPITVVVAIIADADQHLSDADGLVAEALGAVPARYRDGFVFHATEVFGDRKYHQDWLPSDRLHLLVAMMLIPRRLGMAISVSVRWRSPEGAFRDMSSAFWDHLVAFGNCLALADRKIRDYGRPLERAVVIAEDVPSERNSLRAMIDGLSRNPVVLTREHIRRTPTDEALGYIRQRGEMRITRIRNPVHFVKKADDPLVQVADACAFGLRRFFAGEDQGELFFQAILGPTELAKNFSPPGGAECYWPHSAIWK